MEIKIKEINTTKDIRKFIEFPNQLYKDNKYYVPALKKGEMNLFNPEKNPAYKFCESKLWLAYKNNVIVGRVAAIINYKYNEKRKIKNARFGWLDFIDDIEVLKALITTVENWAKEKGMEKLHGPLGFNSLDASGVLVEGFNEMPTSFGHYNYPYYDDLLKKIGFEKEVDWVEYQIKVPDKLPDRLDKMAEIIQKRYNVKELILKSKQELLQYTDDFFNLLNNSYGHLFAFSELDDEQKELLKKDFLSLLNVNYLSLIVDEKNKLVAFGITNPSMAKAIKKAKGRMLPFGWLRIYRALKKNDTAELLLIGIDEKYKNKGLTAIIFRKIMKTFSENGIKYVETTRELENNTHVQQLWSKYEYRQHKRARCYIKPI